MATQSEIKRNIQDTRSHISQVVDDLSTTIHHKVDWRQKIKEHPTEAVLGAVAVGFLLASVSSVFTRPLMRFGLKSAFAALGAYASRQGIEYIKHKVQSR
jgi:hypothetical protein